MTQKNALNIGKRIGNLLEIKESKPGKIRERGFMRLKVELNIEDPSPKGFPMKREGSEDAWIQFRYERLPDFCFQCGHLGHVKKWHHRTKDPYAKWLLAGEIRVYNSWIRASFDGDIPPSMSNRNLTTRSSWNLSKNMPVVE
ncbi:hypothetical protein RJ639_036153 [Escallonia herrerae]|uniref:Zinc knuckle CX2CX4HX4C domain-containing protein n=1 Tax=Escallonia herrerae TaxID=1293975 RepID=A0AA88WQU0_9ASTE|nr:hypothetical protein RJ639_036153 [Escallonia herrerae]